MAVLRLVVDRRAPLHDLDQPRRVQRLARARGAPDFLGERQHRAAVAVGHADERLARLRRRAAAASPPGARRGRAALRAPRARADERRARARATSSEALSSNDGFSVVAPISVIEPSSITGRKESCCARLKRWISSTNRSVPCPCAAARARGVEDLLQFGDAGMDGRDLDEGVVARGPDQPRDRRLAAARRPPEDHRAERRRREQAGQRPVRSGQVLLAGNLGERRRPQPLGERRRRRLGFRAGVVDKAHGALSRAGDPLSSGASFRHCAARSFLGACRPPTENADDRHAHPNFCRPADGRAGGHRPFAPGAQAADGGHGARDRSRTGAGSLDADRAQRQGRLRQDAGRPRAGWAGDVARRDLPHLFDDQADRLGRGDDAGRGRADADHRSPVQIYPRLRGDEGRGGERRRARSRSAQAADHDPGSDAAHVRADLRLHRNIEGAEAGRGRELREPGQNDRPSIWRRWPPCRSCISPERFGNTASRPTCSAAWSRSSRAPRSARFCARASSSRSAWTTPRFSFRPAKLAREAKPMSPQVYTNLGVDPKPMTEPPRFESGGGGLLSTIGDYARFLAMLSGGGALDGRAHPRPADDPVHGERSSGTGRRPESARCFRRATDFGLGFGVRLQYGLATTPGSVGDYFWGGWAGTTFQDLAAGFPVRDLHGAGAGLSESISAGRLAICSTQRFFSTPACLKRKP